ncbi:MAG: replication-associated recombination protein A [Elusimicrobiota bacterium]
MELFENKTQKNKKIPLALRLSPRDLSEFVGQSPILAPGKLLYRAIESDSIESLIFAGPPGCGKSALARIIANRTKSHFANLNAVTCGVQDIRREIEQAQQRQQIYQKHTILLVDEIHHFNKTQQDALLPDVEKGTISLIGITTENPYFYINPSLLSRSHVFLFQPLSAGEIETVLKNALKDSERGFGQLKINMTGEAGKHLINYAEGDARRVLNALEIGALTTRPDKKGVINFTLEVAEECIQKKAVLYDKGGDEHYDTISAFIKSMRGGDPDAVLYWMAKMIAAGEDPRFIARRIIICASEDVGNADPQALVVALSAFKAVELVGMPEGRIPLAQAAIYVAAAPKSNAAYLAVEKALASIKEKKVQPVPNHLRDANLDGKGRSEHGAGYLYPHNYPGHFVQQNYLSEKEIFYQPSEQGYEQQIKERLERWWKK